MKILFLTDNFPPEVNAPATRTYQHCREWVKLGAEVTVITCFPNFPKGEIYAGYKNKLYQKEVIDGINVIRVWSYIASNSGTIKRTLDYLSFGIMAVLFGLFRKTDVIIGTSPQFFTPCAARVLHILKRKPWIFEVRDLWPESIKAVGAISNERILRFLEKLEMSLYKSANKIVVVTDTFKKNISSRGIDETKIEIIKNGVILPENVSNQNERLREKLGLKDKFVVGYIGTHGLAHKLDFILDSAPAVNSNVHFLLIGDGAQKSNLLDQHKKLGLQNLSMLEPIPKEEIFNYIAAIDVALVYLKKSDAVKTVLPSKIFENAALQEPILMGVEGEAKELIESYDAGLCFIPEDRNDFLNKLDSIHSDKEQYNRFQFGCQNLAKDFKREKLALRMYEILKSLV